MTLTSLNYTLSSGILKNSIAAKNANLMLIQGFVMKIRLILRLPTMISAEAFLPTLSV